MDLHEQILESVNRLFHPFLLYEIFQLKTKFSLNLIAKVIKESNKTVFEAVSVVLVVIRYLWNNSGSLQEFIKENAALICKMAIEKRAQYNLPGRALPLFEIFKKKIKVSSISVIELGASYGLIGRCLLNPGKVIKQKDRYFSPGRQFPVNPRAIDAYLGIELSPPDKEWLLAWEWQPDSKKRLENFLHDFHPGEKFKLLQGNVFGFSKLKSVKDTAHQPSRVVVLTSFILYQYEDKEQKRLRDEILEFTGRFKGHWINQAIDVSKQEYFIEFDERKIIKLSDNRCKNWEWLI